MVKINPVILSGGFGTRLWPISRQTEPKQFSTLLFEESLFSKTLALIHNREIFHSPIAVSNIAQEILLKNALQQHADATIIFEPTSKNTALSIALAALSLKNKDDLMLIMPSDHLIANISLFEQSVISAITVATNKIVTFGVVPTYPATGYGYIHKGTPLNGGFLVQAFKEKPTIEIANNFVNSNEYFWNAGIFLCSAKLYLQELQRFTPNTYEVANESISQSNRIANGIYIQSLPFENAQNISIDYAILEKTNNIAVFPMLSGWCDVGDFKAISQIFPKDEHNNISVGNVVNMETQNCTVISTSKLIATLGLENLTIVDTADALLIANSGKTQEIKALVERLGNRAEAVSNLKTFRPWGSYEIIKELHNFKIKQIVVNSGQSLSLQSHKFRSEHWIVTRGTATVRNENNIIKLEIGQSTFIPCGAKHRLSNETDSALIIIEIQIGTYLGEDDITRFDDVYGRT